MRRLRVSDIPKPLRELAFRVPEAGMDTLRQVMLQYMEMNDGRKKWVIAEVSTTWRPSQVTLPPGPGILRSPGRGGVVRVVDTQTLIDKKYGLEWKVEYFRPDHRLFAAVTPRRLNPIEQLARLNPDRPPPVPRAYLTTPAVPWTLSGWVRRFSYEWSSTLPVWHFALYEQITPVERAWAAGDVQGPEERFLVGDMEWKVVYVQFKGHWYALTWCRKLDPIEILSRLNPKKKDLAPKKKKETSEYDYVFKALRELVHQGLSVYCEERVRLQPLSSRLDYAEQAGTWPWPPCWTLYFPRPGTRRGVARATIYFAPPGVDKDSTGDWRYLKETRREFGTAGNSLINWRYDVFASPFGHVYGQVSMFRVDPIEYLAGL